MLLKLNFGAAFVLLFIARLNAQSQVIIKNFPNQINYHKNKLLFDH